MDLVKYNNKKEIVLVESTLDQKVSNLCMDLGESIGATGHKIIKNGRGEFKRVEYKGVNRVFKINTDKKNILSISELNL